MHLSHLRLANFRGIQHLGLDFDPTTILIGENNLGKTSILDVLHLCLDPRQSEPLFAFRPGDFHFPPAMTLPYEPPPIRVELTFQERDATDWTTAEHEAFLPVMVPGNDGLRRLRLRVEALLQGLSDIQVSWTFLDLHNEPIAGQNDVRLIYQLRRLKPCLILRANRYFLEHHSSPISDGPSGINNGSRRELEEAIDRVYRRLLSARSAVSPEEIHQGMEAVGKLLKLAPMESEGVVNGRLSRRTLKDLVQVPVRLSLDGPRLHARLEGTGVQSIGLLMLLGGILEARGPQEMVPEAHPIVAIEDPEIHLHPILQASIWGVIESLSAQKIVTTNSGDVLAATALESLRRMCRRDERICIFHMKHDALTLDETRRISYHVRTRRGDAFFARCWLLVEGETEFWLLPELARQCGYDFPAEGIRCVEFAQCGVEPLVKLANGLGIEWHLLADGDRAGRNYVDTARAFLGKAKAGDRITLLKDRDIEHCVWRHGYEHVFRSPRAKPDKHKKGHLGEPSPHASRSIRHAQRARSKPALALAVAEAVATPGSPGVPPPLRQVIETVVRLARTQSL